MIFLKLLIKMFVTDIFLKLSTVFETGQYSLSISITTAYSFSSEERTEGICGKKVG